MAEAKSFAFNLGQDASNLIIHFNPRFKYHRDTRTIVCNSKLDGKWGEEMWESEFPFQQGEEAKIEISFDAKEVTVKCLEDLNLKFPNRLGLEGVNYLSVEGDFEVHSLKFK
ncbi:16 kDa beta-galactoside-binding lectin-like isoform X2 [Hemicordylus capensis]|nr:16 kDa beta-galactoside-binding lectin-like isoform X2 [Hemicordylus capensis]